MKNVRKSLSLKKHQFLFHPNYIEGESDRSFIIIATWSAARSDVIHERLRSASSRKIIPSDFELFAEMFFVYATVGVLY